MMDWIRQKDFPKLAIANFIILTFLGLLFRGMQLHSFAALNYQFILHAHSHFAFAGWMFFSIALLIAHTATVNIYSPAFKSVFVFTLISAFGMLITFSTQGYRFASISFSTLFILVTYRFTYLIIKQNNLQGISRILIYSSLIFLCISSLGPFSLAPIAAAGFRDSPLYQNAIYFYLHFQMNGFMLLSALGLFASSYLTRAADKSSVLWLRLFIFSSIPLFLIFILWIKPAGWVWMLALVAALVNLVSWIRLGAHYRNELKSVSFMGKAALFAITLKIVLQTLICIPFIGEWTFLNRNLIIGYVHLISLGCVVPIILDQFFIKKFLFETKTILIINRLYVLSTIIYLTLLFVQPLLSLYGIIVPWYSNVLAALSAGFLFLGCFYLVNVRSNRV